MLLNRYYSLDVVAMQVMAGGWVVWEEGKYVSVSRHRFQSVQQNGDSGGLHVTLKGAAQEVVQLIALRPRATAFIHDVGSSSNPHSGEMSTAIGGEIAPEWTVVAMNVTIGSGGTLSLVIQ